MERLHTVIRPFTVSPLLAVALVIIRLCEGGCKCRLDNQDCSLDYSVVGQCACAGSVITVAVSSDVRLSV